jgi:hypothetical protein
VHFQTGYYPAFDFTPSLCCDWDIRMRPAMSSFGLETTMQSGIADRIITLIIIPSP